MLRLAASPRGTNSDPRLEHSERIALVSAWPIRWLQVIAKPLVAFVTLTSNLLTYAMGRGVEYYDMPAVRAIVRGAAAQDYRWSALIAGIVRSTPFQMRTGSAQ